MLRRPQVIAKLGLQEAYLCDDLGVESVEFASYNYDKTSGPCSAKGYSDSLIFDGCSIPDSADSTDQLYQSLK